MGVRIIRGAICSGKSGMCLDEIEKIHNEDPSARCIMIVPDHYSYETEKKFVERFGGVGLNNIEVLTLRRMAINFLSYEELDHLGGAGRQMLIHRAVTEACAELENTEGIDMKLVTSMRRRGFLDVASSLISEMKHYLVTPELLSSRAEETADNRTLKNKLIALSAVYKKYEELVARSGMSDAEDDLYLLAKHIEEDAQFGNDTYIWVNRFDKFLPQQLRVLESLLKNGVNMTISVCCPQAEDETERLLYVQTEGTLAAVRRLAEQYGSDGELSAGKGLSHIQDKPDLYKLFRYWTEDFIDDKKPEHIELFQSRDAYGEVEHIACEITDLVRAGGYRYRDIAILCGDEEEYRHLIEAVFDEYDIPFFSDRRIILSDHPIAMQILSLFSLIEEDWSYDAAFRYLRAGFIYRRETRGGRVVFTPLDQEETDELENFVLKYGIRGAKRWMGEEKWLRGEDIINAAFGDGETEPEADETIDALRREVALPVAEFAKKTSGKKTAREFAAALLDYLGAINLYEGLKSDIAYFNKNGMLNEAEQFTKIWNLILDVLDQAVRALGGDKMKIEEFAEYINVGLSKCEIRTIPSGIDRVYVGSTERASHSNVRAMFIAGAKAGTFPTVAKAEGFLSDKDRGTLKDSLGVTLSPDSKRKIEEQYFKVYRAVCAVSEKLFLSYSVQTEDGTPLTASGMITDIYRKFPKMEPKDNLVEDKSKDIMYISSPKATAHKMLVRLSKRSSGAKHPLWDIVREWFEENPDRRSVLSLLDRADYYNRRGVMLDSDIANMLYNGRIVYSASRINTFARCPFEYFLKYGLGARKREEWDVTPANMGSYAHRVINDFCLAVEDNAASDAEKIAAWRALTDERRTEIIDGIIEETCNNMLSSKIRDRERTAAIFRRMGRTVSSAAALVQKSLAAGSFAENGMECEFEIDITENVAVRGFIDRIDVCRREDGKTYMRIVDYKTGRTEFDVVNIANGYDMQMVIYALAAASLMKERGEEPDVTGIYYTGVKSRYRQLSPTVTEENVKKKNADDMYLDGVTFASYGKGGRDSVLYSMDNDFFKNGKSAFTKIKLDKDGNVNGIGDADEINGLMSFAREELIEMDSRARGGDISLNPYNSGASGGVCAYCDYGSVCRFDENRRVMRNKEGTAAEVWEKMRTKGAAARGVKDDEMD